MMFISVECEMIETDHMTWDYESTKLYAAVAMGKDFSWILEISDFYQ